MTEDELRQIEALMEYNNVDNCSGCYHCAQAERCRPLLAEVRKWKDYFICDWCEKNGENCVYKRVYYGGIDDQGADICEDCRDAADLLPAPFCSPEMT